MSHNTVREGLVIGALGATGVAVWFLIVDLVAGQPLFTPSALGAALFGALEPGVEIEVNLWRVIGYTVFHFAVFAVIGVAATAGTHLAEREPVFLALFLVLFVTLEMGFYGMIAILHQTHLLRELTWYLVGAGNLLATVLMGVALWQRHPAISQNLDRVLSGRPL